MQGHLLVLPLLIPLVAAAVSLPARLPFQRGAALAAVTAHLLASLWLLRAVLPGDVLVLQVAAWPAPFGISFVGDTFSSVLLANMSFIAWLVALYSIASVPRETQQLAFFPLLLVLLAGVSGAVLTGDLFNLYVWFEVLLMASFILLTLGAERSQLEGGLKYVALNLIASAFFLTGVGLLYGATGTLNLADLSQRMQDAPLSFPRVAAVLILFLSFGIKAAVFPLFGWLPASYHTPPVAITALFSALLTKVGVYSMIRVGTLLLPEPPEALRNTLLVVASLTMVTGVLGAVAQMEMKRLLSFHIVSQIGYLVLGFALYSVSGLTGAIYFFVHVSIAKAALFLVAGELERLYQTTDLRHLGNGYRDDPLLAAACFVGAMGLAGLPPLSGFFAKLQLAVAALEGKAFLSLGAALSVSMLTLFSMTKIWAEAFWKSAPGRGQASSRVPLTMRVATFGLACAVGLLGVFAEPLFTIAQNAAEQLLDRQAYLEAVLRGR
ncbi:MAG: proton-conducting transporter membrane subunit [Candidatus Binatia bacterium]|nr:proton-conducting transporter membrane subunit [Candidatus Binatia bacterium]